jgi:uncharacterized BrkB/YihY/UPF0761 family membrane protein
VSDTLSGAVDDEGQCSRETVWVGLGWFSSAYLAGNLVSDSHLYGPIGVMFDLMTWFIGMGAVLILGAIFGAVWHERVTQRAPGPG